jgi:hypothetical protein
MRLIIIQDMYSQHVVRLKTVEIFEWNIVKISLCQKYVLIIFLFSNLVKKSVWNKFVYTAISIKVVPEQSGKVQYERERMLEIAMKIH